MPLCQQYSDGLDIKHVSLSTIQPWTHGLDIKQVSLSTIQSWTHGLDIKHDSLSTIQSWTHGLDIKHVSISTMQEGRNLFYLTEYCCVCPERRVRSLHSQYSLRETNDGRTAKTDTNTFYYVMTNQLTHTTKNLIHNCLTTNPLLLRQEYPQLPNTSHTCSLLPVSHSQLHEGPL